MKWKINKLLFIIIPILALPVTWVYLTKFNSRSPNQITTQTQYKYSISGAVENSGIIYSDTPLTYRELFFRAKMISNSDISSFNLNQLASIKDPIFVPLKNYFLKWKNFDSVKQFEHLDISTRIIKTLLNYKKNNKGTPTWDDILKISGIGPVNLKKLQSFLILE
ncbi:MULTISPECIES: MAG0490 family ComEA-like DNA-binding protein [unclassified Mycoplasma]|uniref:MAG0490 family ComEA-like DNA-binding protein n=1 Tax=unclassified Mycoplasma TaxID=2683645 RepID=UPI00211C0B18|nr:MULTISPECIES: hypothetical protein [unclassified Mycoplasma]UUM20116.1 hypothetical protein NPA11_01680 [Mycoplasma sp. 1578d]UUM25096.1 hypothetical protein NPA12_01655 [Mycoplasma sp. 3686d]